MSAYLYNAPSGIPGDITRVDESNVEPAKLVALSTVYAQRFGEAMRYVSGGIQQFTTGLVATDFAGVLVREVPAISGSTAQGLTDNVPDPNQAQGLLVRGYISVKCTAGTPTRGGAVYVRIVSATDRPIGAFEADSDSSNSVLLTATQATWASDGKDADGNAELRVAR